MIVANTVAVAPTCTERLLGSTAAERLLAWAGDAMRRRSPPNPMIEAARWDAIGRNTTAGEGRWSMGVPPSGRHDDFAEDFTVQEKPHGFRGVGEREHAIDDGLDAATLDLYQQRFEVRAGPAVGADDV